MYGNDKSLKDKTYILKVPKNQRRSAEVILSRKKLMFRHIQLVKKSFKIQNYTITY